jgi:uncharacterized YccA/Bax inhibitor family protein
MPTTMSDIEKRLQSVEEDTKQILSILKSNSDYNTKGLFEQVSDNTHAIRELQIKDKVRAGQLLVLAFIGGAIASFIAWIVDFITFK